MPRRCCVPRCGTNSGARQEATTFKFPFGERRREWVKAIPRKDFEPSNSSAVCILHFHEEDIIREDVLNKPDGSTLTFKRTRPALTATATPAIFNTLTPILHSEMELGEGAVAEFWQPPAKRLCLESSSSTPQDAPVDCKPNCSKSEAAERIGDAIHVKSEVFDAEPFCIVEVKEEPCESQATPSVDLHGPCKATHLKKDFQDATFGTELLECHLRSSTGALDVSASSLGGVNDAFGGKGHEGSGPVSEPVWPDHQTSVLTVDEDDQLSCRLCPYACTQSMDLKFHLAAQHGVRQRQHCELCCAHERLTSQKVLIPSPANCELRSIIHFLLAKGNAPFQVYNEIKTVYGGVMHRTNVYKLCREFRAGRTNVHDEQWNERPSIMTDEMVKEIEETIHDDNRLTLDEMNVAFPEISRSLLHEIVTETFDFRKLCARWVPKQLTDQHKIGRIASSREFLKRFELEGERFLDSIVTGGETWVAHYTPETEHKSTQGRNSPSLSARKPKTVVLARRIRVSVFWDRRGILLLEFLPQREKINPARYCENLQKLRRATQKKRKGMLTKGMCLLYDNAHSHTPNGLEQFLDSFGLDIMNHPPYCPDLAPSDFHVFASLKSFMSGRKFSTDNEVKSAVKQWAKEATEHFFDEGIRELIPRHTKCIEKGGDYIEK